MSELLYIRNKSPGIDRFFPASRPLLTGNGHFKLNVDPWQPGEFLRLCLTQYGGLFTVISTLFSDLYFPKKAPKSVNRTVRGLLSQLF